MHVRIINMSGALGTLVGLFLRVKTVQQNDFIDVT